VSALINMLLRIIALTRQKLSATLKDPRNRIRLFVAPILQCLIFGYAASFDLNNIPYAMRDQDRSAASRELPASSQLFQRVADLRRSAEILKYVTMVNPLRHSIDVIQRVYVWRGTAAPGDRDRRGKPGDDA
jgi:hypothetical protein